MGAGGSLIFSTRTPRGRDRVSAMGAKRNPTALRFKAAVPGMVGYTRTQRSGVTELIVSTSGYSGSPRASRSSMAGRNIAPHGGFSRYGISARSGSPSRARAPPRLFRAPRAPLTPWATGAKRSGKTAFRPDRVRSNRSISSGATARHKGCLLRSGRAGLTHSPRRQLNAWCATTVRAAFPCLTFPD